MLLWFLFAVMTAAALAAVLAPLTRTAGPPAPASGAALGVYRHQLAELDRERAQGLIDDAEASAARLEISRRLLATAAGEDGQAASPRQPPERGVLALGVALVIPVLALALYLSHGSPDLPSYPASARTGVPLDQARLGDLVGKVEARLREHPEDGDGWDVIAPVYMKLARYRDAANAFTRAAQLKGESARRLAGFAEAAVMAADGIVGEEARVAYEKLRALEPGRPEPRFWLALAKEQDGKLPEALAEYKGLLADAPADAAWKEAVTQRVAELAARVAGAAAPEARGPTAADIAAAQKLPPGQQAQMIAGMVEGLAQRLKQNGKDLAGWVRLVNAYAVLGRKDQARAALGEARRNFGGDERALSELSALAASLGLGS
jgi:cytochrome c-type biogenesis protein CcmH